MTLSSLAHHPVGPPCFSDTTFYLTELVILAASIFLPHSNIFGALVYPGICSSLHRLYKAFCTFQDLTSWLRLVVEELLDIHHTLILDFGAYNAFLSVRLPFSVV